MLEWYRTETGYFGLMDECEALISSVSAAIGLNEKVVYGGREISLQGPWERITVAEAFNRYTP
jgi:lysyl-tRNA synthetase class 2